MNPILLRELRQLVRNRLVATGLILFLFIQLAATMIAVLSQADSGSVVSLAGRGIGQGVATTVGFILGFILLLAVPLFTGIRMTLEKSPDNMDLQFATTLRPTQFIDGKTASSVILLLLFASSVMPFLMLAYILRGVDVLTTFITIVSSILTAVCFLHIAIFIGSLNLHKAFRITLLIFSLFFVFVYAFGFGTMLIIHSMMGGGSSMMFSSTTFMPPWWATLLTLAGTATFCLLTRAAASAHIAPPHTNFQRPLRNTVALTWLVWGAAAVAATLALEEKAYILVWTYVIGTILLFTLFGAVSSPSGSSRRTLSEIRPRRRFLQYFTFTGAENGVCFALLFLFLTAGVAYATLNILPNTTFIEKMSRHHVVFATTHGGTYVPAYDPAILPRNLLRIITFICYPAAFLLTMRIIWHYLLHRVSSRKFVGLFAVIWLILASVLPYIFMIGRDNTEHAAAFPGNFIAALADDGKDTPSFHALFSSLWLLSAFVIYMFNIVRSIRAFRRPVQISYTEGEEKTQRTQSFDA